ncbi:phenylalanine--tRNA ligase subunit beta [Candidatus Daviesbacteria bacterium RIFCSPLOWO2_01_FULL_39_12]|uniref:Phenylalanine--tRNA ligase beta subunit n=1 Tax=Candidatus Daviesbacteria bacterium RIFCSPLOWO2_01_FULL_39_12 TaxID=1797785 RepID=A0A1F5KUF5_9BACT|nr:MAG: phenylalanine--tRNA ligase subunit beta [Candidatus Daviesbacteria bacterium RIFCSPLOWO2_01_FULL_39_12]
MKVSISWLKELVDLNCSLEELVKLIPLRIIGIKEVTNRFMELDMKGYNRADLLSMRGIAYEVSAITDSKMLFKEPQEAEFAWNKQDLPSGKVEVQNSNLAPFYTITKIAGLKVQKSPEDWVRKLEESGMRSVDNVTDITNLIMLEYGQPLHAFDARAVKDEHIVVRTTKAGERITTLDGKTRDLEKTDLLIADPLNALGIAGVMGGKDSEVNETTTTILLEAAIFDPVNIKKTTTRLSLPSEASKRFQHGLTKKRLLQALNAAIKMYEKLGGKVTAITMMGDFEDEIRKITLTRKKLEDLVGVKFEDKQVEEYPQKLGFTLASPSQTRRAWAVTVPYWRLDVNIEEDVIEEVARMYGYEKIPAEPVSESAPLQKEDPIFQKISDLRGKLVDLGLTEVQTYSFYSTAILDTLSANKEKLVKVANPISAETEYLRENLWPNLVEVVGKNIRKGYKDIGIFEIGKAFKIEPDGNPSESYRLSIALMNGTDNPLAKLYQIAQTLASHSSSGNVVASELFHPKRQIGNLAEVHLRVLNKLGIEKRVAVLEMEIS